MITLQSVLDPKGAGGVAAYCNIRSLRPFQGRHPSAPSWRRGRRYAQPQVNRYEPFGFSALIGMKS